MKYLLDTHILIWNLTNDEQLKNGVRKIIYNPQNEIYYSPLSLYEIDLKHSKHPDDMPTTGEEIFAFCEKAGFQYLPLKPEHTLHAKNLKRYENTPPHNDPFDKIMLCQAIVENMFFMTHDSRIAEYDTPNIYKV